MLNLSVKNVEVIKAKISLFTEHIKDWRPLYDIFRDEFHAIMREQFASEGAHGGAAWKPLSSAYSAWKAKQNVGRSILVFSGNLNSSLVKNGDPNEVFETDKTSMKIGTSDKKAVWHHFGTQYLPERKIIKFSKEDSTRWVKQAHEWIILQLRGAGLGK
jgi:phage gpG-like protein